jgi:peptide/nickel transport system substrate-binding protein
VRWTVDPVIRRSLRAGGVVLALLLAAAAPVPPAQPAQPAPPGDDPGADRPPLVAPNGQTIGSPHRGGTLRLTADAGAGTADPQINYNSEMISLTVTVYDGLTAFAKLPGEASNHPVADLAEALPAPEDGGLTYVFRLRRGVRFSSGQEVGVRDVVASFQRLFKVNSPTAGGFYGNIARPPA